jgi:hypothetical protein
MTSYPHVAVKAIAISNYTENQIQTEAEHLGISLYLTKSLTNSKGLVILLLSCSPKNSPFAKKDNHVNFAAGLSLGKTLEASSGDGKT